MKDSIKAYSKQKSILKKALRDANFEDIKVSNGYYYFSGFAKKNNQTIYYSLSDVRHFNMSSYDKNLNYHGGADLLIRSAKDYTDYTGGSNNFCSVDIEKIQELANNLTK